MSENILNLQQSHHLLKSVLKFNQEAAFKSLKDSCFASNYDINSKNLAFQKVRECDNARLSNEEKGKRQADEKEYNKECRMETTTHIQQMMANAQRPKPHIPLSKLTENRIHMHAKRISLLKAIQEKESKDQGKAR